MSEFEYVAYFLLGTLATARIVRLIAFDSYPPSAWLRIKWDNLTHQSAWNKILHCGYCLAPYVWAVNLAAGIFLLDGSDTAKGFWVIPNLWLAGSYVASYVVAYDGDDED